jgi:UDP-N-acetylglucosamine--N-acetylmuramyl-(pentapeptide) pyrophosphoryl-undecaprenol N-acetylglucosamine transferase
VIGFGGYVCVPVIQAAHKLQIKTMLHEQNSIVGRANKVLIPIVDAIVCDYEANLKVFPRSKTRRLGNPRTYMINKPVIPKRFLSGISWMPINRWSSSSWGLWEVPVSMR